MISDLIVEKAHRIHIYRQTRVWQFAEFRHSSSLPENSFWGGGGREGLGFEELLSELMCNYVTFSLTGYMISSI